jgi:hypothetical protein
MRLSPEILRFARIKKGRRDRFEQTPCQADQARVNRASMRYLKLIILVLANALIPPAFAQSCCPSGCAQSAPGGCVTTGPIQNSCGPTIPCPGISGSPSGGSSGRGQSGVIFPRPVVPECGLNPTKAQVDATTVDCVSQLTASATVVGCFFEDAAGRAEDDRTGLGCPDRQAALAKQCQRRCAKFASASTTCSDPNKVWHDAFGDISGEAVGSARVDLCGPPLKDSFFTRVPRLRPQKLTKDSFFTRVHRLPPPHL